MSCIEILKLENVYLATDGVIKIGDFGWAIHTHSLQCNQLVGTLSNMAPEMLLCSPEEIDKLTSQNTCQPSPTIDNSAEKCLDPSYSANRFYNQKNR